MGITKGRCLMTVTLAMGPWLAVSQARAQLALNEMAGDHYFPGTEGIQAGSLPAPGLYIDDSSRFENLRKSGETFSEHASTFINEPRVRWISKRKLLGANYGLEVMLPWIYQEEQVVQSGINNYGPGRNPPSYIPGYHFQLERFELGDLEISPLWLSWHRRHFDFCAGYAVWMPTGGNAYTFPDSSPLNPAAPTVPPPQFHWWEHMVTLGATWYPDAAKKWAVSALNHYEINQAFDTNISSEQYGQRFTTEWGLSRMVGKFVNLGMIGNYSQQTTATRESFALNDTVSFYNCSSVEVGPEIRVTMPEYDLSASLRYLRELSNPDGFNGSYNLNVVALTVSKRF